MWRPLLLLASLLNLAHANDPYPSPDDVPEPWHSAVEYRSTTIVGPPIEVVSNSIECQDGQYTFLSPRGDGMVAHGPIIVDQDGELVWTTTFNDLPVYNLDVNTYKGQDYLTFWAGDDKVDGHGDGSIYMLDSSYNEVYKLKGPHGLSADMHEFQITRSDTALFTVYDVAPVDFRSVGGPRQGWIWDGRFVEVDVETNSVLFEWRASEHIDFTDVTQSRGHAGGSYETAWDFFHITGVDKDATGNFLVTGLYADYLVYVDGRTGDVIWRLGGKHSDLKDLSSGDASTFAWPHHARFHDNDTTITLFDNASPKDQRNRGLYLDVDQSAMTVKVRQTYPALERHMAVPQAQPQSQGSLQLLDSGNVLISYGLNGPAWTEYDGSIPRCHAVFGPEAHFGSGDPASYRVSKHAWKGYPSTTPDFEIFGFEAAVSWNGATEVAMWVLEGSDVALPNPNYDPNSLSSSVDEEHIDDEEDGESDDSPDSTPAFTLISKAPKSTFETIIQIPPGVTSPFLRIRALDSVGSVLGTTATLPFDPSAPPPEDPNNPTPSPEHPHQPDPDHKPTSPSSLFFAGVAATLFLLVLLYLFRRCCMGFCLRRRWQYQYLLRRGRDDDDDDDDYWESVYGVEEQEVGLHHMSDTESDDSDDVQVSILENPRLSPMLVRSPSGMSSFSFGSVGGLRSPSPGVERAKQH